MRWSWCKKIQPSWCIAWESRPKDLSLSLCWPLSYCISPGLTRFVSFMSPLKYELYLLENIYFLTYIFKRHSLYFSLFFQSLHFSLIQPLYLTPMLIIIYYLFLILPSFPISPKQESPLCKNKKLNHLHCHLVQHFYKMPVMPCVLHVLAHSVQIMQSLFNIYKSLWFLLMHFQPSR